MGFVHRAFVAAGVGFAVSAIAGCGSSGGTLLSQSQATTLSGELNQVQQALALGECSRAQSYLNDFDNRLNQFGGVNSTLIANLNQGANTIASLTSTDCAGQTVTTPKTHTTTRTRTRTTPTTTTTVTRTIPTFTQTTTTTSSTPTYTGPPPTTSPNGGVGPGDTLPTTSSTTTTGPGNGGTGLGATGTGTDGSTGSTTGTGGGSTTTSGSGF